MLPSYKKPHTISMDNFQDFVGEVLMAQGDGKTLKILTDVSKNQTVYYVEDAMGVISLWDTPQEAIDKYNRV